MENKKTVIQESFDALASIKPSTMVKASVNTSDKVEKSFNGHGSIKPPKPNS